MSFKEGNKCSQKQWKSEFSEEQLTQLFDALGKNIYDKDPPSGELMKFLQSEENNSNPSLTAGYTYLGQFLAHEMTFNVNTLSDVKSPSMRNARTPSLDLDSVYGKGPLIEPIYYDHSRDNGRLYLSMKKSKTADGYPFLDFNRIFQGEEGKVAVPVIPDSRNDENILVAHIHLSIINFHNKMVDEIVESRSDEINAAKNLEEETKIKLTNKIFLSYLGDTEFQTENEEREPTLRDILDSLTDKVGNGRSTLRRHNPVTTTHHEQKSDRLGFYSQIQTLRFELAEIVSTQSIYEESKDPETDTQRTQSELNNLFDKIFTLAKRETVWHFQWLILTDFLPKIVGEEMMNSILSNFSQFKKCSSVPIKRVTQYKYRKLNCGPFEKLPPIFTGAFFRFGHYLVLDTYVFRFVGEDEPIEGNVITVKKSLTPMKYNVKLSGFFDEEEDEKKKKEEAENASSFDLLINSIMTNMISDSTQNHNNNIVVRNLRQTAKMSLPSGQCFAKNEIDDEDLEILTSENCIGNKKSKALPSNLDLLAKSFPKKLKWNHGEFGFKEFLDHSPPWFYMALEAHILADGDHLGPVAGRVVAEVIVKILESDSNSILGSGNLASRPAKVIKKEKEYAEEKKESAENKEEKPGKFVPYNMVDFLRFTNTYEFEKELKNEESNEEGQ